MKSLNLEYLDKLTFTVEQISTLRALGEYRGKQALFFKQSPEALIRKILQKMRNNGEITVSSGGRGAMWQRILK